MNQKTVYQENPPDFETEKGVSVTVNLRKSENLVNGVIVAVEGPKTDAVMCGVRDSMNALLLARLHLIDAV